MHFKKLIEYMEIVMDYRISDVLTLSKSDPIN